VSVILASSEISKLQAAEMPSQGGKIPQNIENLSTMTLGDAVTPFYGERGMLVLHRVAAGETLKGIVGQYHLGEAAIKDLQKINGIKDPSKINVGQDLYLILKGNEIDVNFDADIIASPRFEGKFLHLFSYKNSKLTNADDLFKRFFPTISKEQSDFLKKLNGVDIVVTAGKELWITWGHTGLEKNPMADLPEVEPYTDSSVPKKEKLTVHKITEGQNLTQIAIKYYGDKHKAAKLAAFNGIAKPDSIKVGQIIKIPADIDTVALEPENPKPRISVSAGNNPQTLDKDIEVIAGLPVHLLNGVDPFLVQAIIRKESTGNPKAVGKDGEIGLMQIKPSAARAIAKIMGWPVPSRDQLFNPAVNIKYGTAYFKHYLNRNNGNILYSLMEYNMGEGKFAELKDDFKKKGGKIPDYEVSSYAKRIYDYFREKVVSYRFSKDALAVLSSSDPNSKKL
jgi:LysM repeat protein